MTKLDINASSPSLMLSEGCQSLSNQPETAWIFAFIEKYHTQPSESDMWLFKAQEGQPCGISIWCTPKGGKARGWVTTGRSLEEEVLIFVKDATCYTLLEYLEVACGEAAPSLVPDFVFPGD